MLEVFGIVLDKEATNERPEAKDEWVNGWLEGNLLIPQLFIGINVFTLSSILEEEDLNLNKIAPSTLTPQQLMKAIDSMHKAHAAFSIPVAVEQNIETIAQKVKTLRIIPHQEVAALWESAAYTSKFIIQALVSNNSEIKGNSLNDLKFVVFKIKEICCTQEFKLLADEYRKHLMNPAKRDVNAFKETISRLILQRLFENPLPIEREGVLLLCEALGLSVN